MFGAKVKQALKGLTARNGGVDLTPTMPADVSAAVELYLEDAKNTGAAIAVACERASGTGRVIAWKATGAHAEIASLEHALAQRFRIFACVARKRAHLWWSLRGPCWLVGKGGKRVRPRLMSGLVD